MKQIIKNVQFIDGNRKDIVIDDGEIETVTKAYNGKGKIINVPDNMFVSPGWIDVHTHAFPKYKPYCAKPDEIGYKTGVTTVVDAGSIGADDLKLFHQMKMECVTRVFNFLNISKVGLSRRDELTDMSLIDADLFKEAQATFPEMVVGMKARMSASVVGENGTKPLVEAKKISQDTGLPVMVHVGSAPPQLDSVFHLLEKGDIVTHCFHEKANNNILTNKSTVAQAVQEALGKGVYFDVGHGTSSFSFLIAEAAKKKGIPFHSISTDIYELNQLEGPVYNLAETMTKFLAIGHSLEKVIQAVTETPAQMIGKSNLGRLEKGKAADLTFFTIDDKNVELQDSFGHVKQTNKIITPHAVMINGEYMECRTNEVIRSD
ncbi:MAG TPA: amidohydrolase/deacetylase family metallohydrolase [Pseudogracilibacillus sp.]|nr:amidohydrolase/deacetylase family metallohydrolase [Pseudogracilibacillus sp.]